MDLGTLSRKQTLTSRRWSGRAGAQTGSRKSAGEGLGRHVLDPGLGCLGGTLIYQAVCGARVLGGSCFSGCGGVYVCDGLTV